MNRRKFLERTAGLTLGGVAGQALASAARVEAAESTAAPTPAAQSPERQYLELRLYRFASAEKRQAFEDFLARAVVPAANRLGIAPVGIFRMSVEDNPKQELPAGPNALYVLLPHGALESVALFSERLAADRSFLEAAKGVLDVPKEDPAYLRFESALLGAFASLGQVEVPTRAANRVLQMRIYESHTSERGRAKIAMFEAGGEIAIFRRCGMNPVFFAQTLVGWKLPNLTYMLGFEDTAAMDKAWNAFRTDPAWVKLKDDPAYKDTVSGITNLILRPSAGSQI